jgi:hypothetical protein
MEDVCDERGLSMAGSVVGLWEGLGGGSDAMMAWLAEYRMRSGVYYHYTDGVRTGRDSRVINGGRETLVYWMPSWRSGDGIEGFRLSVLCKPTTNSAVSTRSEHVR